MANYDQPTDGIFGGQDPLDLDIDNFGDIHTQFNAFPVEAETPVTSVETEYDLSSPPNSQQSAVVQGLETFAEHFNADFTKDELADLELPFALMDEPAPSFPAGSNNLPWWSIASCLGAAHEPKEGILELKDVLHLESFMSDTLRLNSVNGTVHYLMHTYYLDQCIVMWKQEFTFKEAYILIRVKDGFPAQTSTFRARILQDFPDTFPQRRDELVVHNTAVWKEFLKGLAYAEYRASASYGFSLAHAVEILEVPDLIWHM